MVGGARNGHHGDMDRVANGRGSEDPMQEPTVLLHLIQQFGSELKEHQRDCVEKSKETTREVHGLRTELLQAVDNLRLDIKDTLKEIKADVGRIQGRWNAAMGAIIASLAGTCGFLFGKLLGWF